MASLLHDDVLDDADTRRGIGSLNFVMGNKVLIVSCFFKFGSSSTSAVKIGNKKF